jgi:hypothetical protein
MPLEAAIGQLLATYRPSSRQGNRQNKQQSKNTPKKVAVLMAMAMRQYVTACVAQWRRSRASLEATGCRHWAGIISDNIDRTCLQRFFMFSLSKP